jgi:transcription initiation factor TFIIF subunit beta
VKVEHVPSPNVKPDPGDTAPSPYMDEDDLYEEDAGDLDFSQAQHQLWLSHIPRSLWETWSSFSDDEEIEIGTIRVEGIETEPRRVGTLYRLAFPSKYAADELLQVSLKLHNLPQFKLHPKEYTLVPSNHDRARVKKPSSAFVFSEKDLPGYKGRSFAMNEIDEDGNPLQGRSYLYEKARRDAKRTESKGRFEPYARRPIPKQTAIAGVVSREFECTPVKNGEYAALEILQAEKILKVPEKEGVSFTDLKPANYNASAGMSMSDKAALNKVSHCVCGRM